MYKPTRRIRRFAALASAAVALGGLAACAPAPVVPPASAPVTNITVSGDATAPILRNASLTLPLQIPSKLTTQIDGLYETPGVNTPEVFWGFDSVSIKRDAAFVAGQTYSFDQRDGVQAGEPDFFYESGFQMCRQASGTVKVVQWSADGSVKEVVFDARCREVYRGIDGTTARTKTRA